MKRILFCAGLLAFMASCTQDEFEQQTISNEAQAPGISFVGVEAEAPSTRGEVYWDQSTLKYKWYAEQDQVDIYAVGAIKGGDLGTGASGTRVDDWSKWVQATPSTGEATPAQYKATRSMNEPWFTGVSNDDILYFAAGKDADDPAEFLAVYPETSVLDFSKENQGKLIIKSLPDITTQSQTSGTEGNSIAEKTLMLAYGTGYPNPDAAYESVGERVNLSFERPMGYIAWKTANLDSDPVLSAVNENLKSIFGNLKSIKVEAKGYDQNGNGDYTDEGDIAPSILNYGNAQMRINMPNPDNSEFDWKDVDFLSSDGTKVVASTNSNTQIDGEWSTDVTGAASEVTLSLNQAWSDNNSAFMIVSPVFRSLNGYSREKDINEELVATYTFENITLKADKESGIGIISPFGGFSTAGDWTNTKGYNSYTLDIAKYPYLVTNKKNDRALIINDATFAEDIMSGSDVIWNGESINPTEFTTIISKTPIYDEANDVDQYSYLKQFTNLKKLVLIKDTKIPANAFNRNTFSQLTEINFPAVIEIDAEAFTGFGKEGNNGLTNVYLKSYPFLDRDIAFSFLDDDKLLKLDMSKASVMNVGFPSQGFTLEGYSNLTEVTVGTVEVGPNSFDGCTNLATIKGDGNFILNTNGFAAFRGTALTTINLVQTAAIPAYAFQNCDDLVSVTSDGTTLTAVNEYAFQACKKLTSSATNSIKLDNVQTIGDYAFYGCKEWTDAKLENTTSIGKCAFKDCSQLFGAWYENNTRKVIKVGAETVGSGAFHMCTAIEHIQFLNATEVERGVLGGASKLIQIQFDQPFTCNVDADESTLLGGSQWSTTFGSNTKNVTLFVNPAQTGRTSTQLTIGDTDNTVITFKSILNIEN